MNNQGLNVLANSPKSDDFMSDKAISELASMINAAGRNRAERKRLQRTLRKTENIRKAVQQNVDMSAYREFSKIVDQNFTHFFACLGILMHDKYHWQETEDHEHGQIVSLFERLNKLIDKYADMNYSTQDICDELYEKTGIQLMMDEEL